MINKVLSERVILEILDNDCYYLMNYTQFMTFDVQVRPRYFVGKFCIPIQMISLVTFI